jgi:hemerythrin-like domain-containing protein
MYSVERLLRVSRGEESPHSTIDRPLEHLVACHDRIEERLATLERAAAYLASEPDAALEAIGACFRYFESSGVLHTADEEQSVFPRLRGKVAVGELAEIERLESQHKEADTLYAELKHAAADLERDSHSPDAAARYGSIVGEFAALYRAHIEFENSELIRMARRELDAGELAAISREMRNRRQ